MTKKADIDLLLESVKAKYDKLEKYINQKQGISLNEFIIAGRTIRGKLSGKVELNKEGDFEGIYVFISKNKPFYVGISRSVLRRLRQHLFGKDGNQASLANRIAKKRIKNESDLEEYRIIEQEKLRKMKVILLNVEDDYEMYMLEVYAAFKWGCEHNSFRTH